VLSIFDKRSCRGTCSSVEIVKGYTVRERLGTPAQEDFTVYNHYPSVTYTVIGSVILVFLYLVSIVGFGLFI